MRSMAGDWIKVEHVTIDKPEVLAMAETLNLHPDEVFGKLFRVWRWFDQQSLNGDAGGVTNVTLMKFIDTLVASQGFAACMKRVGWLTDTGIPNFDRHNGESAKNRALTKRRMKKHRDANVTPTPSPEKRREEIKEEGPHPVGNFLKPVDNSATSKPKVPRGWYASEQGIADAAKILGLEAKRGESFPSLKARVEAKLGAS